MGLSYHLLYSFFFCLILGFVFPHFLSFFLFSHPLPTWVLHQAHIQDGAGMWQEWLLRAI